MDDGERFLAIVGFFTILFGAIGAALWVFYFWPDGNRVERASLKACAPYQVATTFSDLGHELAVCRTDKGLVVREMN